MTRKNYCGTAAKAGGNGENKPRPKVMGVPCLLENYRRLILMVSLVGLVAFGAIADESKIDKKLAKEAPLFERIKMRGTLRDDVSRDVIQQTPGEGYQLRVVQWWPKKGCRLYRGTQNRAAHLDDPSRERDGQGSGSLRL